MGRVAAQMERKGIPAVLESWDWDILRAVSERTFLLEGVPALREVFTTPDPFLESATEFIPQFIDALTRPLTEEEKKSGYHKPPKSPRIAMTGTYDEVQEYFQGDLSRSAGAAPRCNWTDGLPITPPTEEKVAEMLKGTSHAPDEVINPGFSFIHDSSGKQTPGMMPWGQIATVEKVAINAVMAGCKPEYMPVVLAMAEAGGCVGYPGSCSGGHLFIVSGPIAKEIGMNSGGQVLVPGNPANTSLGRAATLIGLNVAGAEPGVGNSETLGNTMWGTTFADSTDSPWETMNVAEGYSADESVLFMMLANRIIPACAADVGIVKGLGGQMMPPPESIVNSLKQSGHDRGAILMFTPAGAKAFANRHSFATAQQLQDYLWENVARTRGEWGADFFFYMLGRVAEKNPRGSRMLNPDHLDLPDDALVPRFLSPKNIKIAVAGDPEWPSWGWVGFMTYFATSIDKWK
jgi:hypothetical protein